MAKINFDNIIDKLKKIRKGYVYKSLSLGLSFLFWYIYLFNKDFNIESFMLYSLFTAITFDNFVAIFIRLPHRYIPEDYPIWANIFIRIILFLFPLFVLIYNLKQDNII